MYKYTKYKLLIDTAAVQQNALNKIHTRSCAELVHKSLYGVHATRASRSVRSQPQGVNSVQIVSSFSLHFSSADRVEFPNCERCLVKIFFTMLKVLSGAAFELGIVSSAFASAPRRANGKMHGSSIANFFRPTENRPRRQPCMRWHTSPS